MRAIRKNMRGFTLVELMIVVAIVGVLAALAIYGVRRYITNAKTAEARNSLGQMAKDASAAYNREAMAAAVLQPGTSTEVSNRLCTTAGAIPGAQASIQGKKYQSAPSDWQAGDQWGGWQCVKFSMQDPQYFMYSYTQEDTAGDIGENFVCTAQGDLDGDGDLSTFTLAGEIIGSQGGGNKGVAIAPNMQEQQPDE